MDYIALLDRYGVEYKTEGKNTRPGWIQVSCPFCDDPSEHLGLSLSTGAAHCWRCGKHDAKEAVSMVLSITRDEADKLMKRYGSTKKSNSPRRGENETHKAQKNTALNPAKLDLTNDDLPSDCGALGRQHQRYLEKRGFDPVHMEGVWELKGTGPMSRMRLEDRNINFKNRILAPIYLQGHMVSFQTRDISDKSDLKYITCPQERELAHHKRILYGMPNVNWEGDTGLIVEGITDAWRLGANGASTFGIQFSMAQVTQIADTFSRVFILYDTSDEQAQLQAHKLRQKLRIIGTEADIASDLMTADDPADMEQDDADALVRQLT